MSRSVYATIFLVMSCRRNLTCSIFTTIYLKTAYIPLTKLLVVPESKWRPYKIQDNQSSTSILFISVNLVKIFSNSIFSSTIYCIIVFSESEIPLHFQIFCDHSGNFSFVNYLILSFKVFVRNY